MVEFFRRWKAESRKCRGGVAGDPPRQLPLCTAVLRSGCVAYGISAAAGVTGRLISERIREHGDAVSASTHDKLSIGQCVGEQVVVSDEVLEVGPCFGDAVIGPDKLHISRRQCDSLYHDEAQHILVVCPAAIALLRLHNDEGITVDDFE